jgi:hypothetical protein
LLAIQNLTLWEGFYNLSVELFKMDPANYVQIIRVLYQALPGTTSNIAWVLVIICQSNPLMALSDFTMLAWPLAFISSNQAVSLKKKET